MRTIISTLRNDYWTALTPDEVAALVKEGDPIPVLPGPEFLAAAAVIAWRPDTDKESDGRRRVGLPA